MHKRRTPTRSTLRARRSLALCACALTIAACSSVQPYLDSPLTEAPEDTADLIRAAISGGRDSQMLVMLSFSGGGTRAAALAYGVMKELSETSIMTSAGRRSLLDEVDVISSVSGGSFTSAYYGLFGDRIFDDFEERFLRRDLQGDLKKGLMKWHKLSSRDFGRSDMAAELYDAEIFEQKTFADFRRAGAPGIIINATDVANGKRLSFNRLQFDLLCIDLMAYPVARAVAASSAVPIAATPITLQNFSGQCDFEPPEFLANPPLSYFSTPRRAEIEGQRRYMDRERTPWIHLVDGGITDNLGLRAYYTLFNLEQEPDKFLRGLGHGNVKQLLIISVNAHHQTPQPEWSRERHPPRALQVANRLVDIQMDQYTADSVELVRNAYQRLADSVATEDAPVSLHFVEVNFNAVANKGKRDQLNAIETSFSLEDEEIDLLIDTGRHVLRNSPQYRAFLGSN